jgi:hypothetical protein
MANLNMTARFVTGKTIAGAVVLALALSNCASADNLEVRQCQQAFVDVPTWDHCINAHNAQMATRTAQESQQESQSESAAAWLLLGGTAFLNGYNQGRPITTTCFRTGMMTQCTTP